MQIKDKLFISFLLATFILLAPLYYLIYALNDSFLIVKLSVIGGFVMLQSIFLALIAIKQINGINAKLGEVADKS